MTVASSIRPGDSFVHTRLGKAGLPRKLVLTPGSFCTRIDFRGCGYSPKGREPSMLQPRELALCMLACLTAAVFPAEMPAACCDSPGSVETAAPRCLCCCGTAVWSQLSQCRRAPGCSTCCPPRNEVPASAPSVPMNWYRPESGYPQSVDAVPADENRSARYATRAKWFPVFSVLSSADRCISLGKLQL